MRSILEHQRRTHFANSIQTKNLYEVLCLTETWLTENIPDAALFLPCYEIHRKDRPSSNGKSRHGGVLIAISNCIPNCAIESDFNDCVIVRLSIQRPVIICCIYSSPKDSTYKWESVQFSNLIKFLRNKKLEFNAACVYIVGDINFDHTNWLSMTSATPDQQLVLDDLTEHNYQQLIKSENGRSLDIILCNKPQTALNVAVDNQMRILHSSDHQPYSVKISLQAPPNHKHTPLPKRELDFSLFAFKKANWKEINEFIKDHPFSPYCFSNPDQMVEKWYEWLYEVLKDLVPRKTKHRRELAPWVTPVSSNLIK